MVNKIFKKVNKKSRTIHYLLSTIHQKGFTLKSAFSPWRTALPDISIQPQRGFTLIELLVVILIISILVSLSAVSYSTVQKRGRDDKRKTDISAIRNALEIYFNDNSQYPAAPLSDTNPGTNYINPMPKDPKDNLVYDYTRPTTTTYSLYACLENNNDAEKDSTDGCTSGLRASGWSYTRNNP